MGVKKTRKKLDGTKAKSNAGRKTVDTPEVRAKIEEAAALDASVEEICFYAGISRESYYALIKRDSQFSDRVEELRQKPILAARQAVVRKSVETYQNAMDYLKRKKKLEFGDQVDYTSGGKPIPILSVDLIGRKNNENNSVQ